ncbi:hypothetical protein FM103_20165 [Corynebacterium xerosis]|nr:hypothetical protein FM103_20165 [Corynebacterium xerosis]
MPCVTGIVTARAGNRPTDRSWRAPTARGVMGACARYGAVRSRSGSSTSR